MSNSDLDIMYIAGCAIAFVMLIIVYYFQKDSFQKQPIKTQLCLTTIINNFKIKILSMQLEKQQFVDSILTLVDHETQNPIEGVVFSEVVFTSSNPEIFTADTDVNNDSNIDVVGISEGTATLNVKCIASYKDANTEKDVSVPKELNVEVTITKPAPEAQQTDLVVTFTNPQPVV